MKATALLAAAAAVGTVALAGCGWREFRAKTVLSQTVPHVAGSALIVETRNGRIEAEAAPQSAEVVIEATLSCGGASQQEADARLAEATLEVFREADQRLAIRPVFPGGPRSGDGASITVRLPGASGVELRTSNGSIEARGLGGRLVADTSNGRVEVQDWAGPAWLDTSNGGIVAANVGGAVEADTSNGSIRLDRVAGTIHADTSNASITAVLGPDQTGPVHLDTSNGSISLRVGPAFAGSVRLSTSNGSISVHDVLGRVKSQSLERNSGHIVVGEAAGAGTPVPESRLDTSNGRIEFTIGG